MEPNKNMNPVNLICDEVSCLLVRETRYRNNSLDMISNNEPTSPPAHSSIRAENKGRTSSPVSIADDSSSYSDQESRGKVCDWMYRIVDHFNLERETVPIALSCYDRYIAKFPTDDKEKYQLIAVTSLYIAVKTHQHMRCKLLPLFSKLSADRFSEKSIAQMESRMLFGLGWLVNPPTPQAFVHQFTYLLSYMPVVEGDSFKRLSNEATTIIMEAATYISEISLLNCDLNFLDSSSRGFASMIVVLKGVKKSLLDSVGYARFIAFISSLVGIEKTTLINSAVLLIEDSMHTRKYHLTMEEMYEKLDPTGIVFAVGRQHD